MYNMEEYESKYCEMFVRQLEIEEGYKKLAEEATSKAYAKVENSTLPEDVASQTKAGQKFIAAEWEHVNSAMKDFVENCVKPKCGAKASYVLLVQEIDKVCGVEQTINLFTLTTFTTLLNGVLKKKQSLSTFAQNISAELYTEVSLQAFLNQSEYADVIQEGIKHRVASSYKRAYVRACMERGDFSYPAWDKEQRMTLAASLVQIVLAASNYFETTTCNGLTEILPSQFLIDQWQNKTQWLIDNSYKFCPCVIPPREWESVTDGGYYGELANQIKLLRLRDHRDVFAKQYFAKLAQLELSDVRKAVNAVQNTPWKINTKVLDVLKYVVDVGGGLAGIPEVYEATRPAVLPENPTEEQLKVYKARMVGFYKLETRRKSILLRILSHIRTAEKFAEFPRIYFPCNMDFRGRIYPVPVFSFQGDDVNKSLIEFADAPACQDEICWDWLLIEGANLAGIDKVSYDDRKKWVMDNEAQIMAVVNDPKGELWWADQDSPCQFLAWCFEYARAKEWKNTHNNSIVGFVCGLNIAFDGTCSGLQHFSAILRDPVGGAAVNLIPSDKPSDIYGIVAEKVNKVLEQDVLSGTPDEEAADKKGNVYLKHGSKFLSSIWVAYGVTRKVTKRSVMTLAYGSKEYGFRDQILEDTIKPDINANGEKSVFAGCDFQAAGYLAKLIWEAVGTTVIAAVEGMKWLQNCARKVTKHDQVVSWTTPMGLPVQQAYMQQRVQTIFTRCAGKQIRLYSAENTGEIDNRSQASGIAPNFIHSMDAAHLQLTICNCCDKGIRHYAMIHDSYGAPLAQAQLMYNTVRESFIQMYSDNDVFQNFLDNMEALADEKLPKIPKKGTLDINVVRESKYIFC